MAIWGAVVTGVIAGGTAYYQSKQQKKQQKQVQDNYDARIEWERERIEQRRNSMGAQVAPYLMDQMLRVYADQTKGRGGFNLPIDEILANMGMDARKKGSYDYSDRLNADNYSGWGYGRSSFHPVWDEGSSGPEVLHQTGTGPFRQARGGKPGGPRGDVLFDRGTYGDYGSLAELPYKAPSQDIIAGALRAHDSMIASDLMNSDLGNNPFEWEPTGYNVGTNAGPAPDYTIYGQNTDPNFLVRLFTRGG